MSLTKTTLVLLLMIKVSFAEAGIFCPPTMYLHCDDDISDTNITMMPTLLGAHALYPARYIDENHTNACNVGYVIRTWFGDANYNNQLDLFEPHCEQTIYLDYPDHNIVVSFPNDLTIGCTADLPDPNVNLLNGPCDLVGTSYKDTYFELVGDACRKIIRHYTVINWCQYDPSNPDWNGEGIWEHDQIIKVVDKQAPEINDCSDKYYEVGADCHATVTLTNSATDMGTCPSNKLFWTVTIDLWADGGTDYTFGYLENGPFKISPKNIGEAISLKIPESIAPGKHKVLWKVKDSCGNVTSCETYFYTQDKKPPTPYCEYVVNSAINGEDGWPLKIHASLFNRGSFDNCTAPEDLKISFSPNLKDTIREITCASAGFQFFQIYFTDRSQNQSLCEVYMIVFDNGSCGHRLSSQGKVVNQFGEAVSNVNVSLESEGSIIANHTSNVSGTYEFNEFDINEEYHFKATKNDYNTSNIDLYDYFALRDHLLGKQKLSGMNQIAADLDCNNKIGASDLTILKKILLNGDASSLEHKWEFVAQSYLPELSLKSPRNDLWLGHYTGNLDFNAVQKGNLINTDLENRNLVSASCDVIEETNEEGSTSYKVVLNEDIAFDGLVGSGVNDLVGEKLVIEHGHQNYMSFNAASFKSGETLFYLSEKSDLDKIKLYDVKNQQVIKLRAKANQNLSKDIISPNPTTSKIHVISNFVGNLSVMDLNGRVVLKTLKKDKAVDINLESFNDGIYLLLIEGHMIGKIVKTN